MEKSLEQVSQTLREKIKTPVTYTEFAKNPLTAMLFIAIFSLGGFVWSMRKDCKQTEAKLDQVQNELKGALVSIAELKSANAYLTAQLEALQSK